LIFKKTSMCRITNNLVQRM